jgi:6-phosphogluconolactonase (cycloisomerase 2 family)
MGILAVLRRGQRALLALAASIAVAAVTAGPALAADPGAVYVNTNTAPNFIQVYDRAPDGTLTLGPRVATGGVGQPFGNPPEGIAHLDSAGAVGLSNGGRLLFVVNAGSNSVSSFRVTTDGLELVDVKPSFGSRPISLTSYNGTLYVLNSNVGSASIAGYSVSSKGVMTPIPGSVQSLPNPQSVPAQIAFGVHGDILAVSERFAGTPPGIGAQGDLVTYVVGVDGVARSPVVHPSTGQTPYGIAFDQNDIMTVSNEAVPTVLDSSVSSYKVSRSGDVTPIDLETTNSGAACWNVVTNDGRYTFITSPVTHSIESFHILPDGSLVPVTPDSHVGSTAGVSLDDALSHNSRYLYVLNSFTFPILVAAKIDEFRVNSDGTLTPIGSTAMPIEGSSSGVAAW